MKCFLLGCFGARFAFKLKTRIQSGVPCIGHGVGGAGTLDCDI